MEDRSALQVGLVWLAGSLALGPVAAVVVGGDPVGEFRSLPALGTGQFVIVVLALLALPLSLYGVARATPEISWLSGEARGRMLWVAVVTAAGLLGWGYAATATFVAGLATPVQVTLAFTVGGLPFALVALLMHRSGSLAVASGLIIVIALVAGLLVADTDPVGLVRTGLLLLLLLLGPEHGAVLSIAR